MYSGDIMDYFPLKEARSGQVAVIREIDKVIKNSGKRILIVEGPVGCGKSAIGMTFAKAFGDAHMITPRKSLQNQYYEDFSEDIVLMKGRSSYPCTYGGTPRNYTNVVNLIREGQIKQPGMNEPNCGTGPCRQSKDIYKLCTSGNGPCPYSVAIETAQNHECVIHNLHSFIFQTAFSEKFERRRLLVIDEAHDIESTVRDFISKKFSINKVIKEDERPENLSDLESWCGFFLQEKFVPVLSAGEMAQKAADKDWVSPRDEYIAKVQNLLAQKDYYQDKFCVKAVIHKVGIREISTTFEFIPASLGNAPSNLLFNMGDYVILMSGTIYDKGVFCKNLGIKLDDAHFFRIPSTFPVANRPIYIKPEYQVDTSFANWNDNFDEMIEKMTKIMGIFHDAKGLIHAPSYDAAQAIAFALPGSRIMTHTAQDFQEKLELFYASKQPLVFISPVCQQGVDFKEDRARFQIITRVPYANTNDEFINYKVQNDFSWYNYQALIVFGQQLGRVNRSEEDYGATFLMDSRFNKFVLRNSKIIPKWVQNALIWK